MLEKSLLGTVSPSSAHRRAGPQTEIIFEAVNGSVDNLSRQHRRKIYNARRSAPETLNQTRGHAPFGSFRFPPSVLATLEECTLERRGGGVVLYVDR